MFLTRLRGCGHAPGLSLHHAVLCQKVMAQAAGLCSLMTVLTPSLASIPHLQCLEGPFGVPEKSACRCAVHQAEEDWHYLGCDSQACTQEDVERPMVKAKLVPEDFLDSWALNIYHDGSQGIQPHYDDSTRFERPVYSLRLFSDSRLSFGTQLYGYTNGAFCVDMPRGAITIMHAGGYAVAGAKHCVRPVDLAGGRFSHAELSQGLSPCAHRKADSIY